MTTALDTYSVGDDGYLLDVERRYNGGGVCLAPAGAGSCVLAPRHDHPQHVAIAWAGSRWVVSGVAEATPPSAQEVAYRAYAGRRVVNAMPDPHAPVVVGTIVVPGVQGWAERRAQLAGRQGDHVDEVLVLWAGRPVAVWERVDELVRVDSHDRPLWSQRLDQPAG